MARKAYVNSFPQMQNAQANDKKELDPQIARTDIKKTANL